MHAYGIYARVGNRITEGLWDTTKRLSFMFLEKSWNINVQIRHNHDENVVKRAMACLAMRAKRWKKKSNCYNSYAKKHYTRLLLFLTEKKIRVIWLAYISLQQLANENLLRGFSVSKFLYVYNKRRCYKVKSVSATIQMKAIKQCLLYFPFPFVSGLRRLKQ